MLSHVLVVDDEVDVLDLVRTQLGGEGLKITTVDSGEKALKLIDEMRFDLVVLDVVMPEMSGLDVLRKIRGNEKLRHIPVLLFTALGREVDMMLKSENKADGYLAKPFTRKQMVKEVQALLK